MKKMKKISAGLFTHLGAKDKYVSILNTWGSEFDKINVVCGINSNISEYNFNEIVLDVNDSYASSDTDINEDQSDK